MNQRKSVEADQLKILYVPDPNKPDQTEALTELQLKHITGKKKFHWVDYAFKGKYPGIPAKTNYDLALVNTGPKTGLGVIAKKTYEPGDVICAVPGKYTSNLTDPNIYRIVYGSKAVDASQYMGFPAFFQATPTTSFLKEIELTSKVPIATENMTIIADHPSYHADMVVATRKIAVNEPITGDYLSAFYYGTATGIPSYCANPVLFAKQGGGIVAPTDYKIGKPAIKLFDNVGEGSLNVYDFENKDDGDYKYYIDANSERRLTVLNYKCIFFDCKPNTPINPTDLWIFIPLDNNKVEIPISPNLNKNQLQALLKEVRHFACIGHARAIQKLFDIYQQLKNAINEEDQINETILSNAINGEHDNVIKVLLKNGSNPSFRVKEKNISKSLIEIYLEKLVAKGVINKNIDTIYLQEPSQNDQLEILISMFKIALTKNPIEFTQIAVDIKQRYNLTIVNGFQPMPAMKFLGKRSSQTVLRTQELKSQALSLSSCNIQ